MAQQKIGIANEEYDLVSVLYHSLQGAETCNSYIKDAQKEGDQEAVQFFHEVQDSNRRLAEKARQMLADRVSGS